MARLWFRIREKVQALLYKLGPTYCILLGSFLLFCSFIIQLITSIGLPFIRFYFYR